MRKKRGIASKLVVAALALSLVVGGAYVANKGLTSKADSQVDPEIEKMLLNEDDFANSMVEARKLTDANKKVYSFKGLKDVDIYCESHIVANPKATIVMVPGYTENLYSYEEMFYYFNQRGYSTFMLENRGHSRSGRLGADEYQIYVDNFEDYVTDLNTFVNEIVKPNAGDSELIAYAHSMGGLVMTRYLETYPDVFKKAVLNSPMHGVNTGKFPTSFAKLVSMGAAGTFFGKKYVTGQKAYSLDSEVFEESGTTSKARFDELTLKPRQEHPELCCGGASYKWLYESYKAIDRALDKKNEAKIKAPVLLFSVPNDTYVNPSAHDTFVKNAPNAVKKVYDKSKHEIYKSTNDVLAQYLTDIFTFYEQ